MGAEAERRHPSRVCLCFPKNAGNHDEAGRRHLCRACCHLLRHDDLGMMTLAHITHSNAPVLAVTWKNMFCMLRAKPHSGPAPGEQYADFNYFGKRIFGNLYRTSLCNVCVSVQLQTMYSCDHD